MNHLKFGRVIVRNIPIKIALIATSCMIAIFPINTNHNSTVKSKLTVTLKNKPINALNPQWDMPTLINIGNGGIIGIQNNTILPQNIENELFECSKLQPGMAREFIIQFNSNTTTGDAARAFETLESVSERLKHFDKGSHFPNIKMVIYY